MSSLAAAHLPPGKTVFSGAVLTAALVAAGALSACGPSPQGVAAPEGTRSSGLAVAVDPGGAGETVVVSANVARTFAGHFHAGDRVRIDVLDTQWNHEPGTELFDARGVPGQRCAGAPGDPCIGGDSPLLGLILLVATAVPEDANRASTCMAVQRLYIPNGAEFTVPVDAEIALGPNDWEDGLSNNRGAVEVVVERASGKKEVAVERTSLSVSATSASTAAGQFRAGEYVRVTVVGGRWNGDPGQPLVDSAGYRDRPCDAVGHVCVGGERKPLMGLVLMMSCFKVTDGMMPLQRIDRSFIPAGTEIVLAHDADLYLAPNDRESGLANNAGSARVRVRAVGR